MCIEFLSRLCSIGQSDTDTKLALVVYLSLGLSVSHVFHAAFLQEPPPQWDILERWNVPWDGTTTVVGMFSWLVRYIAAAARARILGICQLNDRYGVWSSIRVCAFLSCDTGIRCPSYELSRVLNLRSWNEIFASVWISECSYYVGLAVGSFVLTGLIVSVVAAQLGIGRRQGLDLDEQATFILFHQL